MNNKENNILEFSKVLEANKESKERYQKQLKKVGEWEAGKEYDYVFNLTASATDYWKLGIPDTLIRLDLEDIEYFVNKYLPQLKVEMQTKIDGIIKEYE